MYCRARYRKGRKEYAENAFGNYRQQLLERTEGTGKVKRAIQQ
jgi:hypothetical protein